MTSADAIVHAMMEAHRESALANDSNVSSTFIRQMATIGKSFTEATAAAILTLGDVHGPLTQTRQVLFNMENDTIEAAIEKGMIIPGFGNHFHKDGIDPKWVPVAQLLESDFPELAARINEVADLINSKKDKKLYPNPAAYTAAVAEIIGVPPGAESGLVIIARMPAWTQQWYECQ